MISFKIDNGLQGNPKIPGDKSISHRALILSAMSTGKAYITNLLESDDVMRTFKILKVIKNLA